MSDQAKEAIENLRAAIRENYGVSARHSVATHVREDFDGETVEGDVHTFELNGHPDAQEGYAWEYETDEGRWLVATVLGVRPINSARDAVRAYIARRHHTGPTMD